MADEVDDLAEEEFDEAEPDLDEDALEGDIDEDDLEDDLDEDLVEDADELEVVVVEEQEEDDEEAVAAPVRDKAAEGEEDEDDEDLLDPDDVEADLDTILKDRIAAAEDEEEDEEDEPADVEDRSGDGGKIQPRRPGEFVCQSCFLVKSPPQLADAKRMLCVDCV